MFVLVMLFVVLCVLHHVITLDINVLFVEEHFITESKILDVSAWNYVALKHKKKQMIV
jgi:hypothetical protein